MSFVNIIMTSPSYRTSIRRTPSNGPFRSSMMAPSGTMIATFLESLWAIAMAVRVSERTRRVSFELLLHVDWNLSQHLGSLAPYVHSFASEKEWIAANFYRNGSCNRFAKCCPRDYRCNPFRKPVILPHSP